MIFLLPNTYHCSLKCSRLYTNYFEKSFDKSLNSKNDYKRNSIYRTLLNEPYIKLQALMFINKICNAVLRKKT